MNNGIPSYGFPCYSSGESQLNELVFIKAMNAGLSYLQEAAADPAFENPPVAVIERPTIEETEDCWEQLPGEQRPNIVQCDENWLMKEVRMLRRWRKFEEKGEVPDSDSYSDTGDA